jgi:ABC-type cobalamin/Fe3+-siderophores transport system ATPase subunit
VWLTWKDLTITATNAKGGPHRVLQSLTGYAKSDYIMAIVEPCGFGKSSLLTYCSVKF